MLWKEVQRRLQLLASSPEGPADPLVRRAADQIKAASICSNMTGWFGGGNRECGCRRTSGEAVCPEGCFFSSSSRTVLEVSSPEAKGMLMRRGDPFLVSDSNLKADFTFPWNISLVNECVIFSLSESVVLYFCFRRCWIVRPSMIRLLMSPFIQAMKQRCRQSVCSGSFEFVRGFCRSNAGIIMAAFSAIGSRADPSP